MPDLLLLSGGIDSSAIAAWLRPDICLTVDYGQRAAKAEILASTQICKDLGLAHHIISANIASLGSGDMAGAAQSIHSAHTEFWPYRNQYLLTLGVMTALKNRCTRVLIGSVLTDKRHADGSPQFLGAIDALVALQEGNLHVAAPAINLTTSELVLKSKISDSTLAWAHSCHVSDLSCGQCRGCQKHSEVMQELGWPR